MARRSYERLKLWASAVISLAMPAVCEVCGGRLTDSERHLCLSCLTALPRTNLHLTPDSNDIHHRVSDHHILVDRAASMFHYYRTSPSTSLILSAKYRNRPSILTLLGSYYAAEIAPSGFFDGMDRIVPVPLHWTRRLTRGYNQAEYLARGLSRVASLPVDTSLLRLPAPHSSQTRHSAAERAANVSGSFKATSNAGKLRGSAPHLLVVDDVITTGSTVRDCLRALSDAIPDARLSVLSLGLAHGI